MAFCGSCGAQGNRIRSRWEKDTQLPDECPACAPQSFEKQTDPSDKKIWIGPEVRPNDYEKRYDEFGLIYMPKPEITAELEQQACGRRSVRNQEEQEALRRAEAEKRNTRRTRPMTASEIEKAMNIVDLYFRPLIEDPEISYDA